MNKHTYEVFPFRYSGVWIDPFHFNYTRRAILLKKKQGCLNLKQMYRKVLERNRNKYSFEGKYRKTNMNILT